MSENLYQKIEAQKEAIKKFAPQVLEIPKYVSENLKYDFYYWQKEAFENLLYYENEQSELKEYPSHLMFNMATGSGKTMVMAAAILYYYKQGYRNFIFFVNQNNIVDKTENNFLDASHNKYLFKDKIVINDKLINIKKVEQFSDETEDIEIKFTTIHKLYNDIHLEKENQTTYTDLLKRDIVMLADEAHHLNADTQRNIQMTSEEMRDNTSQGVIEKLGWEHTVIDLILKKNNTVKKPKNILLEFTATIPANENVAKKYSDKIIYKFGLKEFLQAGYTKEINLISSTLDKKERILQAMLFNWYRHKIALDYGIPNFKPVILFRSKTIDNSREDYSDFLGWIQNLKTSDFDFLKNIDQKLTENRSVYEQGRTRSRDVIEYIKRNNINYNEVVSYIQYYFSEKNCIITNSKDKTAKGIRGGEKTTTEQDQLLNNLEDKNNHIRAIFTVDRLTEGWDVLNLYDIVRLYQGQNTGGSTKKTPEATVKEKQLIGRGVRYYPFTYKDEQPNKRKFDKDLKHPLRVLEELYYYTYDEESRYISELKKELRKDGYIQDDKIVKTFKIKEDFKKSQYYQNVKIYYNKPEDNPNKRKKDLSEVKQDFSFSFKTKDFQLREEEVNLEKDGNDIERVSVKGKNTYTHTFQVKEIEKHIFHKAIQIKSEASNSLLRYSNLKEELNIESIDDLLRDEFFGDIQISINTSEKEKKNIDNKDKLDALLSFIDKILVELKTLSNPKIGGEFVPGTFEQFFGEAKQKTIKEDPENKIFEQKLKNEDWYIIDAFYGSTEEQELINFIQSSIGNLQDKYNEVYLLRNEEQYKIYDFQKGRGFQPDFLLLLKDKDKQELYYQVFIEPKGSHLIDKDSWKNDFLLEITQRYRMRNILENENKDYVLIGLPFFNVDDNIEFEKDFRMIMDKKSHDYTKPQKEYAINDIIEPGLMAADEMQKYGESKNDD